jgi:hypothetical protein
MRCVTVFSSSNYGGENSAAFLQLHANGRLSRHVLLPRLYVRRAAAKFVEPEERKKKKRVVVGPISATPHGRLSLLAHKIGGLAAQKSLVAFPLVMSLHSSLQSEPMGGAVARQEASDGFGKLRPSASAMLPPLQQS